VSGDLLDPRSIEKAMRDLDYIIHIAGVTKAKRRSEFFEGNVVATRNLLQLAAKVPGLKKFCYLSSLTAVGPSRDGVPPDESTPCNPISEYGKSKLEAEHSCLAYASSIPLVILRPPTVYGPRDKDVLEVFKTTKLGIQPNLGSRDKTLSLLFGPDLADAIVRATVAEASTGKTYFVSDPTVYSQAHLFSILANLVGRRSIKIRLPSFLVYSAAAVVESVSYFGPKPAVLSIEKARDFLQTHWTCNPERIRRELGYSPKIRAEEGLQSTYTWYRAHGWL